MAGCHDHCEVAFTGADKGFKRALWAVIAINGGMFLIELSAGIAGQSQALKADALDFLGDTATYGLSLLVVGMAPVWRARAAVLKGFSLAAMALLVLGLTAYRVIVTGAPSPEIMGGVGFLALAANLVSVLLLLGYRRGDANVRSVWLCSRNDAIGNLAVIAAAGLVWVTATPWPDLAVAALMAGLFLNSSLQILRQARGELRHIAEAKAQAAE